MFRVQTASGASYLLEENGVFSKLEPDANGQTTAATKGQLFADIFNQLSLLAGQDERQIRSHHLVLMALLPTGLYRSTPIVKVEAIPAATKRKEVGAAA